MGIVGVAGVERQLVMHRMKEPARRVGRGHPAPPLQHEVERNIKLEQEGQDRDRHHGSEDADELMPERGPVDFVGNLNGVAEVAVEEIEANAERDLKLIDEDQEEDVDAPIETLAQRD